MGLCRLRPIRFLSDARQLRGAHAGLPRIPPARLDSPFVVRLIGEYVIEILQVINRDRSHLNPRLYRSFLEANPAFFTLARQRVVSYWDCYYRSQRREDYPGFQILDFLQGLATSDR